MSPQPKGGGHIVLDVGSVGVDICIALFQSVIFEPVDGF